MDNLLYEDDSWPTEHIRRYWLFNKRVVVYETTGYSRPIVDEWFNTVMETLKIWPPAGQSMLAIHDMRHGNLTNYVSDKAKELTKANVDVRGHSIIILPKNLYGQFMKVFVNTVIARDQPHVKRQIMTSMEDAIAYMQKVIEDEKVSQS